MIIKEYDSISFHVQTDKFLSEVDKFSFKTLGGKLNETGWVFPFSKRNSVELYLNNGLLCPATPKNCDKNGKIDWNIAIKINDLKTKIDIMKKRIIELEMILMTR